MSSDDQARHLQERIDHASSADDLRGIFQEFSEIEGNRYLHGGLEDLREVAFETARRRSREVPSIARAIILESLLPLCLRKQSGVPPTPRKPVSETSERMAGRSPPVRAVCDPSGSDPPHVAGAPWGWSEGCIVSDLHDRIPRSDAP